MGDVRPGDLRADAHGDLLICRQAQGDIAAELAKLKAELDKERRARTELETRLRETEKRLDTPARAALETVPAEDAIEDLAETEAGTVAELERAPMLLAREELPFERMQRETAELRQTARTRSAFSSIDAQARIDRLRQETREDMGRFLMEATLLADAAAGPRGGAAAQVALAEPRVAHVIAKEGPADAAEARAETDDARAAELEGARRATKTAQAEVQEARLAAKAAEERAVRSEGLAEEIRRELEAIRAEKESLSAQIDALESVPPGTGEEESAEASAPRLDIEAVPESEGVSELEDGAVATPTEEEAEEPVPEEDIEELPKEGGLAEALVTWGGGKDEDDEAPPEQDRVEEATQSPETESADGRVEAETTVETEEPADLAEALQAWGAGGEEKAPVPEEPSPEPAEAAGQTEAEVEEGEAKPVGEEEKHSGLGGALRAMREKSAERAEQDAEPEPRKAKRGKAAMVDALQRFMRKE